MSHSTRVRLWLVVAVSLGLANCAATGPLAQNSTRIGSFDQRAGASSAMSAADEDRWFEQATFGDSTL
jgi:hypothetical protein